MKKFLVVLVLLTIYLNFGWVLGTYYHKHIYTQDPKNFSLSQHILTGGWDILARDSALKGERSLLYRQITFSLLWPIPLLAVVISWVAWIIYHFLWLIFAGGVAKIIGIG
ncbi:MAG: hypothetical protein Q8L57_01515 [bacterium]|nr:hypothetical protein [bacterium]